MPTSRKSKNICPLCRRAQSGPIKDGLCDRCVVAANTPAKCAECGKDCKKATAKDVYPDQHYLPSFASMANKVYWQCECGAYVGSHEKSGAPLGTAAGRELRELRSQVHKYFDRLWQHFVEKEGWQQHVARSVLYGWLAGRLGIVPGQCHIALFDTKTCLRAIEACQTYHFPDTPLTT